MVSYPAPGTPLTVIAVSNMLGDIFDCALALGLVIRRVVLNQPEVLRARTISYRDRLGMLLVLLAHVGVVGGHEFGVADGVRSDPQAGSADGGLVHGG